jgi:putative ABC transport system permease protein
MLVKNPGFTAVAVLTLALGIGANTAIFSIVEAVLLRPLPYQNPQQLVAIWQSVLREKGSKLFAPYSDFENWRDHSRSFVKLAGITWATNDQVLTGYGAPRNVLAVPATVGFFSLLGVSPGLGRTFNNGDLSHGCTVVLTHRFWQNVLGANASIIGQDLQLNNQLCTVVGIMPQDFVFYPDATDLWTLITPISPIARKPDQYGVGVFGRLRPGISKESAESEVSILARHLNEGIRHGVKMEPVVYPLHQEFTWLAGHNLRTSLLVLFAAVNFVLLICCVNVANLLLGRSLVRQKELTIRAALGSHRGRIFRQLLTESLMLALCAAAPGILLAEAGVRYFRAADPVKLPPGTSVAVDLPILAFTVVLAVLTTVLFGVLPASKASRVNLNDILKSSGRISAGKKKHTLAKALIVVEVALSIVLLVESGLVIESVERFATAPLGFQVSHLMMLSINPPTKSYVKPKQRVEFYGQVLDDLRAVPGLQAAALSTAVPLRGVTGWDALIVEGRPAPTPQTAIHDISQQAISDGYLRVMGMSLRSGREFDDRDSQDGPRVAIINEALALKYFSHEDPLGRHIRLLGEPDEWLTVVGIAEDEKRTTVYQEMAWLDSAIVYRPISQQPPATVNLLIRGADRIALGVIVQSRIEKIDPSVMVGKPETVERLISDYLKYPRFRETLLGCFAAVALLLAAIGLYGVLSQFVAQHTHHIGVRMTLGATPAQVMREVLLYGGRLIGAGLLLGLTGAAAGARVLTSLLYGVKPIDPLTFFAAPLLLTFVAVTASYVPARRATKVDPMVALRYE